MLSGSTVCSSIVRKSIFLRKNSRLLLSTARTAGRASRSLLLLDYRAPNRLRSPLREHSSIVNDSDVPTNPEPLKLRSFADMLPELVLTVTSVAVVTKSRLQYSKAPDSSYDICFQKAVLTNVARDPISCGVLQGGVKSSFRRCSIATRVMCSCPEALQVVENYSGEKGSDDFSICNGVLSVAHLDNAMFWSVDEHNVLLYIQNAAEHAQG